MGLPACNPVQLCPSPSLKPSSAPVHFSGALTGKELPVVGKGSSKKLPITLFFCLFFLDSSLLLGDGEASLSFQVSAVVTGALEAALERKLE